MTVPGVGVARERAEGEADDRYQTRHDEAVQERLGDTLGDQRNPGSVGGRSAGEDPPIVIQGCIGQEHRRLAEQVGERRNAANEQPDNRGQRPNRDQRSRKVNRSFLERARQIGGSPG